MKKYIFAAIVRSSEKGGFWAEVPDLPGCYGQGKTFLSAVESISNGVETHLAALHEMGLPIPKAHRITTEIDGEVAYIYALPESVPLSVPTVSASEAARMLNVSPSRVSHLIRDGRLVAERTAMGTNVALNSIEALMATPRRAGRPRKKSGS